MQLAPEGNTLSQDGAPSVGYAKKSEHSEKREGSGEKAIFKAPLFFPCLLPS